MKYVQKEKPFSRNPETQLILGAEPFDFGQGSHAVLFLHGWTSSPRELRFLAQHVSQQGFRCKGILFKGHGLTARALRNVTWKDYLEQSLEAFSELSMTHEKVSVCGLSMGGLVALHLAARRKIANLVLLAPFLYPCGHTLGVFPNRWLVTKLPEFITHLGKDTDGPILDPEALKDHIAYHAMPTRELMTIVEAAQQIRPLLDKILSPTLIVHSIQDKTSDFEGSLDLMRKLGASDKSLIALNRSNHIVTLDFDRPQVERDILHWLKIRV